MKKLIYLSILFLLTSWSSAQDILVFPWFQNGGTASFTIALTNNGQFTYKGTLYFQRKNGNPLGLNFYGQIRTSVNFDVPPGGTRRISPSAGYSTVEGYAVLVTKTTFNEIDAAIIHKHGGRRFAASAVVPGQIFRSGVDITSAWSSVITLINIYDTQRTVIVGFQDRNGSIKSSGSILLSPGQQITSRVDDLFPSLPATEIGNLIIVCNRNIAVSGQIQYLWGTYEVPWTVPIRTAEEFWINRLTEPSGLWFLTWLGTDKYAFYQQGYTDEEDYYAFGTDKYGDPVLASYLSGSDELLIVDPSVGSTSWVYRFIFATEDTIIGCGYIKTGSNLGSCYSLTGSRFDAEEALEFPPESLDEKEKLELAVETGDQISSIEAEVPSEVLEMLERMEELLNRRDTSK